MMWYAFGCVQFTVSLCSPVCLLGACCCPACCCTGLVGC
jgi:hypothetical protein